MIPTVYCLVDLGSLRRRMPGRHSLASCLTILRKRLSEQLDELDDASSRVVVRLYHGWIDCNGISSPDTGDAEEAVLGLEGGYEGRVYQWSRVYSLLVLPGYSPPTLVLEPAFKRRLVFVAPDGCSAGAAKCYFSQVTQVLDSGVCAGEDCQESGGSSAIRTEKQGPVDALLQLDLICLSVQGVEAPTASKIVVVTQDQDLLPSVALAAAEGSVPILLLSPGQRPSKLRERLAGLARPPSVERI